MPTKMVKGYPAADSVAAWANEAGVNVAAAEGLRSKLTRVFNRPYIIEDPAEENASENSSRKSSNR
ncbi:MAG: hypothetical protein AB9897_03965 [Anaerolineaceae bacterium]